jgi:hypothetical protein
VKTLALVCFIALAGCTTTNFNDKLAGGYQSVTAVRATTTTLLTSKIIDAKDAQNVQNVANEVRTGLDIARDIHVTNPALGDDKLASALTILQSVQKYLGELLK